MITASENELYFDLFPKIDREQLPEVLQSFRLRSEVLDDIHKDPETLFLYNSLSPIAKNQFIDFCMGNRGLQITYDPFFKKIFNKERLEHLLSSILGESITILDFLPNSTYKSTFNSSVMIMDVIVQLSDGSIVDVEIQRVTHNFPIERAICYGSDIILRQYDLLKEKYGNKFQYSHLRPVYVIVLMEEAAEMFNAFPDTYLHKSSPCIQFDSGLLARNLLQIVFISLDIFRKIPHNELNELEAFMYFLSSDQPRDIARLLDAYPEFAKAYQEIIQFRYNPKEMLGMLSDAIRIMDQNAVKSMMDELKEEFALTSRELASLKEEVALNYKELTSKREELALKNEELASKDEELASKDEELASKDEELASKDEELALSKQEQLSQKAYIEKCETLLKQHGISIPN